MGVTLYELCALKRPFDTTEGLKDLNNKILKGDYEPIPDWYSQDMRDLIKAMLIVDNKKRPTIKQIL